MNVYWRHAALYSRKKRKWMAVTYVSEEGKQYQQDMRNATLAKRAWFYSEDPLRLRILLCFADDRVHDCDNYVKPLQDALKYAGVFRDDRQIKNLEVREGPHFKPRACFIALEEYIPDPVANLRWIQNPVG